VEKQVAGESLNGSGKKAARTRAREAAPAAPVAQNSAAESFAQIVGLLMRDRHFRGMPLGDLEWLLVPPIVANQYALAKAPAALPAVPGAKSATPLQGRVVPVAVAIWACVSDSIDKAMTENPGGHPKLRAADWTSGENVWIMTLAGNPKSFPKFLEQLAAREFKGKKVKMRVRDADGKVSVRTLPAAVG
jgi:cytolysin-activating lysine-acyltransferase